MRKIARARFILVLVAAAAACFADGGTEVSGRIRDASGRPLQDVHVEIVAPYGATAAANGQTIATTMSRSDGCFDAAGMHRSGRLRVTLRASKDGFKPYIADFVSGFYTNDITLASADSAAQSSGRFVEHDFQRDGRAPCQR